MLYYIMMEGKKKDAGKEPGDAQMRQNMGMHNSTTDCFTFGKISPPIMKGNATPFDRMQVLLFQHCEKQTEQEDK